MGILGTCLGTGISNDEVFTLTSVIVKGQYDTYWKHGGTAIIRPCMGTFFI